MDNIVYLELPYMPGNCHECLLSAKKKYDNKTAWVCTAFMIQRGVSLIDRQRPKFCPLKEVDASEFHEVIIKNFKPNDKETEEALIKATEQTIEKYFLGSE